MCGILCLPPTCATLFLGLLKTPAGRELINQSFQPVVASSQLRRNREGGDFYVVGNYCRAGGLVAGCAAGRQGRERPHPLVVSRCAGCLSPQLLEGPQISLGPSCRHYKLLGRIIAITVFQSK